MLVLSRQRGEEVVIGSNVHITVIAVQGNRVKLGITAPRDVVIRRAELDVTTESTALAAGHDSPQLSMAVVSRY